MLTDDQRRVLCKFRDIYPDSRAVTSPEEKPIVDALLSLHALRVELRVYAFPSNVQDTPGPLRYQFNPDVGNVLLQEFEQAAQEKAAERAKQDDEQRAQALEKRADRRRDALYFFAGLVLGWLLGGFTPQEVFAAIRNLFP
ncbi:MAG: hypothetical protein GXY42_14065 [Desulfovibrionales bacterium]|nr:hypothetical protein [Desulfovibrionales bacterium]